MVPVEISVLGDEAGRNARGEFSFVNFTFHLVWTDRNRNPFGPLAQVVLGIADAPVFGQHDADIVPEVPESFGQRAAGIGQAACFGEGVNFRGGDQDIEWGSHVRD